MDCPGEGERRSSKRNSGFGLALCYAPHKQQQQLIAHPGAKPQNGKGLMSVRIGFSRGFDLA
jgi:hypothetical protein